MPDTVNPYASPSGVEPTPDSPDTIALRRLGGPAMGLIVLSAMTAPGVVAIPFLPIALIVNIVNGTPDIWLLVLWGIAFSAMSISNCLILVGAWNMRRGTRYRLAYATAVLACIPVLTASAHIGIPFGIWALIVLKRRDVKEAFARKSNQNSAEESST